MGWSWPDALAGGLGALLLASLGITIGVRGLRSIEAR